MDCKGCAKSFTPNIFSAHTQTCRGLEQQGLDVKVTDIVKVPGHGSTAHYEFKMLVTYQGHSWFVYKRFKQFFQLHNSLRDETLEKELEKHQFEDKDRSKSLSHSDKKNIGLHWLRFLRKYISSILPYSSIQNSEAFRDFLQIKEKTEKWILDPQSIPDLPSHLEDSFGPENRREYRKGEPGEDRYVSFLSGSQHDWSGKESFERDQKMKV